MQAENNSLNQINSLVSKYNLSIHPCDFSTLALSYPLLLQVATHAHFIININDDFTLPKSNPQLNIYC